MSKQFYTQDADFAANSGFALEYGAHLEKELAKRIFPNLIAKDILYIDSSMPDWAPSTIFRGVTAQGKLALVTTETTDIQNVEVQFAEALQKYQQFALGWTLTEQQIQESRQTGIDIQNEKAVAAYDIAMQGINNIYLLGHEDSISENGLQQRGLYNHDGIRVFEAATGVYALIKNKDVQGIINTFAQAHNAIKAATNQRFGPNVCVMPTQMYNALQQSYGEFGSGVSSGITFMQRLKESFPLIKEWLPDVYIDKAGADGKGRIVMLNNDKAYIKGHEPMPMRFGAVFPEMGGRVFRSIGDVRSGGLEVRSSDMIAYIDKADDFPELVQAGFSITDQTSQTGYKVQTVSQAVANDIATNQAPATEAAAAPVVSGENI